MGTLWSVLSSPPAVAIETEVAKAVIRQLEGRGHALHDSDETQAHRCKRVSRGAPEPLRPALVLAEGPQHPRLREASAMEGGHQSAVGEGHGPRDLGEAPLDVHGTPDLADLARLDDVQVRPVLTGHPALLTRI